MRSLRPCRLVSSSASGLISTRFESLHASLVVPSTHPRVPSYPMQSGSIQHHPSPWILSDSPCTSIQPPRPQSGPGASLSSSCQFTSYLMPLRILWATYPLRSCLEQCLLVTSLLPRHGVKISIILQHFLHTRQPFDSLFSILL